MDVERLTVGTVLYDTRDASVSCTVVNVSKDWVRVELPNGSGIGILYEFELEVPDAH